MTYRQRRMGTEKTTDWVYQAKVLLAQSTLFPSVRRLSLYMNLPICRVAVPLGSAQPAVGTATLTLLFQRDS